MKELRHICRSRERWAARRAARARWFSGQEPIDTYGMRVWLDWARHQVREDEEPLKEFTRQIHRDYVRLQLGL